MSETTMMLVKLIGPIMVVFSIGYWFQREYYTTMIVQIKQHSFALLFAGMVEVVVGLAIVLNHNVWGSAPEVIVTLVGWCMLIEGALIALGGKGYGDFVAKIITPQLVMVTAGIGLIVGVYISWVGYFA